MPRSKTIARERTFPAYDPEWPRARRAQLKRTVIKRLKKLWAVEERVRQRQLAADQGVAQEKAPDLATGGLHWEVIPARPFSRRTGITVLDD